MGKIQSRLDNLQPYVTGIRYLQNIIFVDAVFKDNWVIQSSENIKQIVNDENTNHYIFYSEKEGITIDNLLDYIEKIININNERELKHQYLILKVDELKKIFKENNLSKLKTLKFIFGEEDLISDEISLDEDISIEEPIVIVTQTEIIPIIEESPVISKETHNNSKGKIELPPKGKIKLEVHELPKEMTEGTCNCGPDEYCPKCMDEKGL
jgi:hypothetical protein